MSGHIAGKIDTESVKRAVAFIERLYPVKTGDNFKAATGISADTFRKWRDGVSAPGWRHSLRMILVFGPEFLAATLDNPPAWLDAASRQEMAARLQSEIAERERRLADLRRP